MRIIQERPSYSEYINSYYEESDEIKKEKTRRFRDPDVTDDMIADYFISGRQGDYFEYTENTLQAISTESILKTSTPLIIQENSFSKVSEEFYYLLEYGDSEY